MGTRRYIKADTVQPALLAQSSEQLIVVLVRPSVQEIDVEPDALLAAYLELKRLCPERLRVRFLSVIEDALLLLRQ